MASTKPYSRGLIPSLPQSLPEFLNIELLKVEKAFDTVEVDIAAGGGGGGGSGTTTNSLTINAGGTGGASPQTFNGLVPVTISYNTIGAAAASHTHSESDITGLTADLAGKQPLDGTLTAFAGLAWTSGVQIPALTAADTFALKTVGAATGNILDKAAGDSLYQPIGSYLTANQTITISGDGSGSGSTAITFTLANSGVVAGTYGDATHVPQITFDAKGRATSASSVAISAGAMTLIEHYAADGTTGTHTFSSIPGTYTDLVLVIFGRGSDAANQDIAITLNGASTGYDQQRHYATATTTTGDNTLNGSSWGGSTNGIFRLPGSGATAGFSAGGRMEILGYSQTTFHKSMTAQTRLPNSTTTGSGYIMNASGQFRSTAAITSLTAALMAGNYVAGSYLALYGRA